MLWYTSSYLDLCGIAILFSGSLSAWFRSKYPYKVDGAVATSAPIFAKLAFYGQFLRFLYIYGTPHSLNWFIVPQQKKCFLGYTGISLSVCPSVCVQNATLCQSSITQYSKVISNFKVFCRQTEKQTDKA